jgi:hypothetical protein
VLTRPKQPGDIAKVFVKESGPEETSSGAIAKTTSWQLSTEAVFVSEHVRQLMTKHAAFLSAATLVAADYRFTCRPRFMFVCLCGGVVVGTDEDCNSSAARSPIELKLGGDLRLVSQISVHVLVLRFIVFHIVNKQTNKNPC